MTDREPSILVGVPEAARLLSLHPNTVRGLIADGALPSFRIGRRRMIRRDSIEEFLTKQEGRTDAR